MPEFVRLHGAASDDDVATVLAQLCDVNDVEPEAGLAATLAGLPAAVQAHDALALPGGLQLHAGGPVFSPGCCCGLETWREWLTMPQTGQPVWWGHDPDGQVYLLDTATVRAVSGSARRDLARADYTAAVAAAEADLIAFLDRLQRWLEDTAPSIAPTTIDLFAAQMHIR